VTYLCRQHTRCCDWEDFDDHEELLDEVRRKRAKLGKRMIYKKKKEMREKYLKESLDWILGTIKRELNLIELSGNETTDDLHDQRDIALAY
jgi:hypothetical protein